MFDYVMACLLYAMIWIGLGLIAFEMVFETVLWLRGDHDCRYDVTVRPDAGGESQPPRD